MKTAVAGFTLALLLGPPHAGAQATGPERPGYRVTASVEDDMIIAEAWITAPPHLLQDGCVRIDTRAITSDARAGTVVAVTDPAGRTAEVTGRNGTLVHCRGPDAGPRPVPLGLRYRLPLGDGGFGADLGYYLYGAERPDTRWYPEVTGPDGPVHFADFDVTLEWPDTLTVLTSGARSDLPATPGRRRARFRADHIEGFTLALASGHERIELTREGLAVEVLAPPDLREEYRAVGERALEAAVFYRDLYGFFPKERLGVLPGPHNYTGGWPLPNVFMVHRGRLTEDFVRFITAHELGHYYWGLHVLDEGERLGWLMLANGIIADQLYLADHYGRTLEEQWRASGYGDWLEDFLTAHVAGWEQRLGLDRDRADGLEFDYNSLIRHGKGATGLYLQVRRLGVDRFVALQRALLREYRHRPLGGYHFFARLEAAGADGAVEFFDRWARGDASIGYEVLAVRSLDDTAGHQVIVGRVGTVPYPIEVEIEGDRRTVRRTLCGARRDTLVVPLEAPVRVRFDPDGAVPMWNSAHPEIRGAYIHALYRAGLNEPFLVLARDHLARHDDPRMLRRLERLLERTGELEHGPPALIRGDGDGGTEGSRQPGQGADP